MSTRERAIELTAYANEARERGWNLNPIEVRDIDQGALRALLEYFPTATSEDVADARAHLSIRACTVRSEHGAWPPGKGSWFDREIDRMLDDPALNPLFAAALLKN